MNWLSSPAPPGVAFRAPDGCPEWDTTLSARAQRIDELATTYGDLYRGVAITNYFLGFLAVCAALLPIICGWSLDSPDHSWSYWGPRACAIAESGMLLLICLLYLRARSPREDHDVDNASAGVPRIWNQRWHERWLDYRGLAERMRFIELYWVLGTQVTGKPEPTEASDHDQTDDWAGLYFRWQLQRARLTQRPAQDHLHKLLHKLHEQQAYHNKNAARCEQVSHRLHRATAIAFILSFLGTFLEFIWLLSRPWSIFCGHYGFSWLGGDCSEVSAQHEMHLWLLFSAILPAFAAALHGIHNICEFAKIARNSQDMKHALDTLRLRVEQIKVDPHSGLTDKAKLEELTAHFLHLCTDETSGWRSILWDKNVPVG